MPNHFVKIDDYIDAKLQAMACYKGQIRDFPHPRSHKAIEALAMYRGATIGCKRAEAFMTIRTIE